MVLTTATLINGSSSEPAEQALWVASLLQLACSPASVIVQIPKKPLMTLHQTTDFDSKFSIGSQIQTAHGIKEAVKVLNQRLVFF
jgi:hypothetical protein